MLLSEVTTTTPPVRNAPRTLKMLAPAVISDQGKHKKSPYRLSFRGRSVYLSTEKDAVKVRKFVYKILKDRYNG